jgi:predicted TIM-barrel fold metal-dependent hydrolase
MCSNVIAGRPRWRWGLGRLSHKSCRVWIIASAAIISFGTADCHGQSQALKSHEAVGDPRLDAMSPAVWRRERRIIDLHQHIETSPERFNRAVGILDRAGVGLGVILGAGTVTAGEGETSAFEKSRRMAESLYPGRFMHHMLIDYSGWDDPGWSDRAVAQIDRGHELGAAGLKEFKRLGLFLKDSSGALIKIDDPKLDPVWRRCGELGMPVSIHVGDPEAFWLPYDESNERWTELKDHPNWWFGDATKYPPRLDLLEALNRVIERHPKTDFVCVHFANNPEDLQWVDRSLDRLPNMYADMAARIPELGRHDPSEVRRLFEKHQDRILFATDFMVYNKLILGSGGDFENPTDEEGVEFFVKCWRWMETDDRDWAHMTPIQGDWTINSIDLSPEVCRKIYFDNARRLFARSIPLPVVRAVRIEQDFVPDGKLDDPPWKRAVPARLEYRSGDSAARPDLSTPVRVLWSDRYLYLGYECPYREISVWSPPAEPGQERLGLWDFDVVEAFIGSDPERGSRYTEFEWAPSGESLDLRLDLPEKDFQWTANAESAVVIDEDEKVWRVEVRIPIDGIAETAPAVGTRWRINLFRHDRSEKAGLAFSPTLTTSFHVPERFGWLEFTESE